jgi:hypothetical protein
MPSTRTIALTATSVLAIVAAGVIGATAGSRGGDEAAGSGPSTSAVATTAPPSSPGAQATTGTPGSTSPSGESTTSSAPDDTTAPAPGSEILPTPAGPSSGQTGYHLPAVSTAKPQPMFDGTMPAPASAKGRLVTGFPTALAPPQGTRVESSSVSVASDMLQAALVATGGDADAVLAHYRQVLSARGFAERKAQGVENSPAAAFTRGRNNVTITIQDGKTYVLANLRPRDEA